MQLDSHVPLRDGFDGIDLDLVEIDGAGTSNATGEGDG